MNKSKKASVWFIFITLLIDVTGFGIIIPVMPGIIQELTGTNISGAARFGAWLVAVYAGMQFLFAPLIGAISDRYGRRPVLLCSLFGFFIDYLLLAFAPTITWLFIGRFLAGIFGASFTTAGAYIADISEPEKRAQNFGMMGAAFGMGFVLGPVIGGLLGDLGNRVPFFVAAGLTFCNWLYGYFILPESLKEENRRTFTWQRANPIGTIKSLFRFKVVAGLFGALALLYLASHAVQSNWSFYTIEKFKWTETQIGISLGVVGIVFGLVQGVLIRKTIPLMGEERSIYTGLALYAIGFMLYAFANQGWMMYGITIVYCLGGIAGPALQGVMSKLIPANEQGELQGGFTSVMSLTAIVGPLLMNGIFSYYTSDNAPLYFPGAAMLVGGILTLGSAFLAWVTLKKS
ncbi:MAG: TCR/Tet family MFS transporter [Cyclobacteriaceae bacterium]|jgi:DHA1 family tetracycline resistance protein-like MFS transporter|nr:TCR/Tet family MFS transporter [Cytophagales bacterium]MCZ8327180.1 TCR/Tet family MFS transporter [Cyclobacteriaceae bacterium]